MRNDLNTRPVTSLSSSNRLTRSMVGFVLTRSCPWKRRGAVKAVPVSPLGPRCADALLRVSQDTLCSLPAVVLRPSCAAGAGTATDGDLDERTGPSSCRKSSRRRNSGVGVCWVVAWCPWERAGRDVLGVLVMVAREMKGSSVEQYTVIKTLRDGGASCTWCVARCF